MKLNSKLFLTVSLIVMLMVLSNVFFIQIDITNDKRYSLSKSSLTKIKTIDEPLIIDIFLEGDIPETYIPFRNELDAILNRLKYYNSNIVLKYSDPFQYGKSVSIIEQMKEFGFTPEIVVQNKNGSRNENIIFPWAIFSYKGKSQKVELLQKQLGDNEHMKIIRSIQLLENKIMDGIFRVSIKEKKNIAILSSHGTSKNIKIADLLKNIKPYYNLSAFNFKKSKASPVQSLDSLKKFDLLIISNASKKFTQSEKYILDQYNLNGGRLLWMVNGVAIDRDSLFNKSGKSYLLPNDLNLEDYFFNYGFKIKKTLIQDIYCAPIVVASGNNDKTQYIPYPWVYYPIIKPEETIIGKDTAPIICRFASPIEAVDNRLSKSLLLKSSNFIKTSTYPGEISLEQATKKITPSTFNQKSKAIGYLVQGENNSLFKNRIKPFKTNTNIEKGNIELVVISDGNLAENQIDKGSPLPLGYDKWTNNFYANRSWIINVIHSLVGNSDYLVTKGKKWNFAFFDTQKTKKNSQVWKWTLISLPILIGIISLWVTSKIRSKHLKL